MGPMLLDTSTLQNLRYVSELLDGSFLTDEDAEILVRRRGHVLGRELVALGTLLPQFGHSGPAWLVSETSLIEFERATGGKPCKLLDWWVEWADYAQSCAYGSYPGARQVTKGTQGQTARRVLTDLWRGANRQKQR